MPVIGYARVSTEDQIPLPQSQAPKSAGCAEIQEEQAPDLTRQAICTRLEAMRESTPRGRTSWQPTSVKMLLKRVERLGLLSILR